MPGSFEEESDFFNAPAGKPSSKKHRLFWARLYDRLTDGEARSIDGVMEKAVFRPGQTIYQQGASNRSLYFLEVGHAKHIYTQHGREIFINKIKAGNIAGEDNFFNAGYCTTTLIAIDQARVRFLSAERLQEEEAGSYAALEAKLRDFCAGEVKIQDLLKRNAQDRRQHTRVPLQGPILVKPVDDSGQQAARSLRGEMRDVSRGGMAVEVKLERREQVQILLGNNFKVRFNLPPNMMEVERIGQVLGVRCLEAADGGPEGQNKYSLNIRFAELVAEEPIVQYARYLKRLNVDQH